MKIKNIILGLFLALMPSVVNAQPAPEPVYEMTIKDEGVEQGVGITSIDCVGSAISCTTSGVDSTFTISGGGGTPGGSNPQLQYNNAGSFGGVSGSGVDANGNVGIGTTTANDKLEVAGAIRLSSTGTFSGGVPRMYLTAANGFVQTVGTGSSTDYIMGSRDGSQLITNPANSTTLSLAVGGGNVGVGNDTTPDAILDISKSGSTPPLMVSSAAAGDGDYLVVKSDGNVGIGQVSPSQVLDVTGAVRSTTAFRVNKDGSDSVAAGAMVYLANTANNRAWSHQLSASNNLDDWYYNGTSWANLYTLSSAGNVGIGSTVPGQKLDIAGAIRPTTGFVYSSALNGTIYKGTANGMVLQGVTGTDNDVGIFSAAGGNLLTNPTGTNHINLGAASNNVGINSVTPNANLAVVGTTGFPIAMFQASRAGIQGIKIANTNTAQKSSIVLAEEAGNSLTPFVIARNGSTAATDPLAGEINNVNAGDLKLMTNNTERMRITSAGNVGIGGDTTPDAIFETAKVGSTPPLMVSSSASGDGDYMIVKSDGNVGIGTTVLTSKLAFPVGTTEAGGIVFGADTNLYRSGANVLKTDDSLVVGGTALYVSTVCDGASCTYASTITGGASKYWSATTNGTERIRIDSAGNVGIGSTNPGVKLDVAGAIRSTSAGNALFSGNVGISSATPGAALDVNGHSRFKTAGFLAEVDDGNSSTADTIDWTTGNRHKSTMTDNCTYTFTAPTTPTAIGLKLVQDGTGSRTATWPAAVKWPGGTAPTLTTTAAAVDYISCFFDGTNYLCNSSLDVK